MVQLRVGRSLVQSDTGQLTYVHGRSPTPRSPNHQVRLLVARAGQPIEARCNTSGPVPCLGSFWLTWEWCVLATEAVGIEEVEAVKSGGGGGGGRSWCGVLREGLQCLLSGQGSTALRGPDRSVVDVPVILQAMFQQSKVFFSSDSFIDERRWLWRLKVFFAVFAPFFDLLFTVVSPRVVLSIPGADF